MDQFIGLAAAGLGVNPSTLRYYEAKGLLPPPSRTKGGYRVYDNGTRFRVRFISKAKSLGLTLKEIQTVLAVYDRGKPPCRAFQRLLQAHVRHIDTQIRHLRSLRGDLRNLLSGWPNQCETDGNGVCPRLEDFTGTTHTRMRIPVTLAHDNFVDVMRCQFSARRIKDRGRGVASHVPHVCRSLNR